MSRRQSQTDRRLQAGLAQATMRQLSEGDRANAFVWKRKG